MSPPAFFWKAKSPVNVTKFAMVALNPVAVTAVTPLRTLMGAVRVPTVAEVATSLPVLL